jgi:hypothetical protein
MADLIHEIMVEASQRFGGDDRVFNAAGFGLAFARKVGLNGPLDGIVVQTILSVREDVEHLSGAHYRVIRPEQGPRLTRFDLIG